MDLDSLDAQYQRQAQWFQPVRSALLRRVNIAGKRHVLEIGCGTGVTTEELVRRCRGEVTAVDIDAAPLAHRPRRFDGARRIIAGGEVLPFADESFDLVFTQMLFLWLKEPVALAREATRVLKPGCELLLAAEPDAGERIEYPDSRLGPRLIAALRRLGADGEIARILPGVLQSAGFQVQTGLHASLFQPDDLAAAWAGELKFLSQLEGAPVASDPPPSFLFMPYFWCLARA